MSAIEERLGQKIARLRRAAGRTQAELAERVGLQPEHISRVENGKRGVSIEAAANIAEVLGIELHVATDDEVIQFHRHHRDPEIHSVTL